MNIEEINAEGLGRELQVTVAANDLLDALDVKVGEIKDTVQLKGFRQGKVPIAHIRKTYGRQLMGEVVQAMVNETINTIMEQRNEQPIGQPQIKMVSDVEQLIEGDSDLVYDVIYEILPEINLMDFSKLELSRPVVNVDDKLVQEEVEGLAASRKNFAPRAKTAKAQRGDQVKIDYFGRIDGEEFEGGAGEMVDVELGAGQFIPGFEDQIIGAKQGDELEIKVTFPADYGVAEFADKEALFTVLVHAVRAPEAVLIDDAFAKSQGVESIAKLKAAMKQRIQHSINQKSRMHVKATLHEMLNDEHDFELPPSMVQHQFEITWGMFEEDLQRKKQTIADLDKSEKTLRADYMKIAERMTRGGLIISQVAHDNKIVVSQEELDARVTDIIRAYPSQERQLLEYYQKNPHALNEIRMPLLEDKVIDFILEMAVVRDEVVPLETLMANPKAADAKAASKAKKPANKSAKKKATAKKPANKPKK